MKPIHRRSAFLILCLSVGLIVFSVSYTMLGQGPGEDDPNPADNVGDTPDPGGGAEEIAPEPGEPGPVAVVNELDQAIYNDDVEALRSLLEGGANANLADDLGNTPLYTVIQTHDLTSNTLGLLNTLIQHAAFVNHANHYGATPLSFVVAFGGGESEGLAKALIDAGANPHIITSDQNGNRYPTPYQEALEEGNFAAAAAMRAYPGHTEPDNLEELQKEGRLTLLIERMVNSTDPEEQRRLAMEIVRGTYEGDNLSEEEFQAFVEQMLDFESPFAQPQEEECDSCDSVP